MVFVQGYLPAVLSVALLTTVVNHLMFMGRMSMRPIHRIKHVIDSEGALTAATTSSTPIIAAVDAPTLGSTTQVETGAKVNGIYLHVEVSHTSGAGRPNVYLAVFKNPGGNLSAPNPTNVGGSDNKRFVIHQEMIMMSGDAGNGLPRPLFNGVIAIPRGYRRFGPNDTLIVALQSKNVAADFCLQCHYKEFR